jgi:hypothetical protein
MSKYQKLNIQNFLRFFQIFYFDNTNKNSRTTIRIKRKNYNYNIDI